jgi:hypothetical protein
MPPTISEEELKELNEAKAERDRLKAERALKGDGKEDDDEEDDDEEDDDKDKSKKKKSSKGKKKDDDEEDDDEEDEGEDLRDKARRQRDESTRRAAETKTLEKALKFNFSIGEFVKSNSDLLPSEIPEILKASERETYDSEVEKASAVKTGFIQSFFAVQSNLDLLTENQKKTWEDYCKLTKSGKEQKAAEIYENLFEPAFEILRRVKKAEDVGKARGGFGKSSKVEDSYKDRLIAGAKKTYLGEKGDK